MENVVYDKIWLNINGVYSMIMGLFIVLFSGFYVFFWMNIVVEMLMFDLEIFVNGERKDLVKCSIEFDR